MKRSSHTLVIPGLVLLCAAASLLAVPSLHLPQEVAAEEEVVDQAVPVVSVTGLGEAPPGMRDVLARHLFVPQRKATGQNSFPDLVVKGVFVGAERSAILSLKSKPQANLRVWEGRVDAAVSQIMDPNDLRQPIAGFLREWSVKEIGHGGLTVEHFITGETETYAVDYAPPKKIADDASRGYGQGIVSQVEVGRPAVAGAPAAAPAVPAPAAPAATPPAVMADKVTAMMQQMTPDQKRQFWQRMQATGGGGAPQASLNSRSAAPAAATVPRTKTGKNTSKSQNGSRAQGSR